MTVPSPSIQNNFFDVCFVVKFLPRMGHRWHGHIIMFPKTKRNAMICMVSQFQKCRCGKSVDSPQSRVLSTAPDPGTPGSQKQTESGFSSGFEIIFLLQTGS
ncbi:hypothetical protein CEXT_774751 [Caerostris extrusa]|uniref:Uncharacterized protein n=1 Tax=Caerostris extrusa TaxID=172846 RepID=A0AAV4VLB9_CAEEX|nr:hypothetical protein CEXT_774751 [Caerostris extrusa]